MPSVSATDLRRNLFDYLGKAARGDSVVVRWHGKDAVRMIPVKRMDWRDRIRDMPRLKVDPEKAFSPLAGIWKKYR